MEHQESEKNNLNTTVDNFFNFYKNTYKLAVNGTITLNL
jgi:hypothetical protein